VNALTLNATSVDNQAGADINNRIVAMWDVLTGLFEAKELYDERYASLIKQKGIAGSAQDVRGGNGAGASRS
jgi:hypothetical protein